MEIVALLVIIGAWEACKAGYRQLRDHEARSRAAKLRDINARHPAASRARRSAIMRRHQAGYWAAEAVKGFPQARHGFASGWTAHRTAADEARLARAAARAGHEEKRVSIRKEAVEHRARIARALAEQERLDEAGQTTGGKQKAERKPARITPIRPLRAVPDPPGAEPDPRPADDGWPAGVPRRRKAEGSPSDDPEAAGVPPPASGSPTHPATRGAPVPATTETTYTQDIEEANAIVSETEQHLADLKRRRWMDRLESLANAGLDPASLSSAADMNDSINTQIKAAEQTIEHATAFRDGLIKTHSAGHEYHSGTQNGGAEKSYLADR